MALLIAIFLVGILTFHTYPRFIKGSNAKVISGTHFEVARFLQYFMYIAPDLDFNGYVSVPHCIGRHLNTHTHTTQHYSTDKTSRHMSQDQFCFEIQW